MRVNRGLVFWGVALIVAGAVALAIQADAIAPETARQAWRLWPLALIVIGLAVIAARTPLALVTTLLAAGVVGGLAGTLVAGWPDGVGLGCGGEVTERAGADGTFDGAASVELDFDCGDLSVSTASGEDWSVDAGFAPGGEPEIDATSDELRVSGDGGGIFGFTDARQEWDVVLPTGTSLNLVVNANAASSSLDLDGAQLTRLQLNANAGDLELGLGGAEVGDLELDANAAAVDIEADADTEASGSISLNAGSLDLCVPDTLVVAITLDDPNVTFSHNLDERGFTQQGDTWRTGDGPAGLTLEVEGNAASLTLNPDGGCS